MTNYGDYPKSAATVNFKNKLFNFGNKLLVSARKMIYHNCERKFFSRP